MRGVAVLLVKTESSMDFERNKETSIKPSALSMLLSSYQILNIGCQVKDPDLEYLEGSYPASAPAPAPLNRAFVSHTLSDVTATCGIWSVLPRTVLRGDSLCGTQVGSDVCAAADAGGDVPLQTPWKR
ncbi:unnamed protein product [Eretmochelys imbricata]